MADTFMTIIAVMIAVVLLFAVQIVTVGEQNDIITQATVETMLSEFVNTVSKEGKITQENYDSLIQRLYATGNSYTVSIEVQIMHSNLINNTRKAIGENAYYSVFKNDIEEALSKGEDYNLKQGDRIIVKVENTNVTFGTQLKSLIYNIIGKDSIVIEATASALVTTTTK